MHVKPYLGEGNVRGKSGFTVNRSAVNRGFTVVDSSTVVVGSSSLYNCLIRITIAEDSDIISQIRKNGHS